MTEADAKTKWCPMVRVANGGSSGFNRNSIGTRGHVEADTNCIGSECMMWRKEQTQLDAHTVDFNGGYCGLAGKP